MLDDLPQLLPWQNRPYTTNTGRFHTRHPTPAFLKDRMIARCGHSVISMEPCRRCRESWCLLRSETLFPVYTRSMHFLICLLCGIPSRCHHSCRLAILSRNTCMEARDPDGKNPGAGGPSTQEYDPGTLSITTRWSSSERDVPR